MPAVRRDQLHVRKLHNRALHDAAAAEDERARRVGERRPSAVLVAWHCRLSVTLQKGNAACLFQAGRLRGAADLGGGTGWDGDLEDLLRDAAAFAAAGWGEA